MPFSESNNRTTVSTRYSCPAPSTAHRNGTGALSEGKETHSELVQRERDSMDRYTLGATGTLLSNQYESQSSLSLQSIVVPPVLERLVASSWGGQEISTWAEITKQNASSGPSIYHEHYSSEEEDAAEELGKVSFSIQQRAASPVRMDWNESSPTHNSLDISKKTAFTKGGMTSFSTFQTSDIGTGTAFRRFHTSTPPPPLADPVGTNGRFATIKDAAHEQEYAIKSLGSMTLEDDEFDDEMEIVHVNTKNGFGIKDECRKFSAITPSPDILRMQRSPLKTPLTRESDCMDLSPPYTRHAFQTVFVPSPNFSRGRSDTPGQQVPVRIKRSTSTFSYPPPIYLPDDESETIRRAEMPVPPALESKVPSSSHRQFLPRMPTVESHIESPADGGKESFTLLPRGGNFKIRTSKRKDTLVEYTLNLVKVQDTTTPAFTSNLTTTTTPPGPDPYLELHRATSPMMDHHYHHHHPLMGGRESSTIISSVGHHSHSRRASPNNNSETSVNANSSKSRTFATKF